MLAVDLSSHSSCLAHRDLLRANWFSIQAYVSDFFHRKLSLQTGEQFHDCSLVAQCKHAFFRCRKTVLVVLLTLDCLLLHGVSERALAGRLFRLHKIDMECHCTSWRLSPCQALISIWRVQGPYCRLIWKQICSCQNLLGLKGGRMQEMLHLEY